MCLVAVDPCLLLRALEHQYSDAARLLSLLICGLTSQRLRTLRDEYDEIVKDYGNSVSTRNLARVYAKTEQQYAVALDQQKRVEAALGQHLTREFLLVTSPPLRAELMDLAQEAQVGRRDIRPHRINREILRCTHLALLDLDPAPFYIGSNRVSDREYLIHTAIRGECAALITEDDALTLPGDGEHRDPRTGRTVRPYTLDDFLQHEVPSQVDFGAIEPPAVFAAFKTA